MPYTNTRDVLGDQETLDALVTHTLPELYEDGLTSLASRALHYNSGLTYVEMPNVVSAGISAFASCRALISVSLPKLSLIATSLFAYCSSLTTVYAPLAAYIYDSAFTGCWSLEEVNLPNVIGISPYAFGFCKMLQSATFSTIGSVPTCTFSYCYMLKSVNYPDVSTIGNSAFYNCVNLRYISMQSAHSVYGYAFYNAPISKLSLPNLEWIGTSAVGGYGATEVDTGAYFSMESGTFRNAYNLQRLILRSPSVVTLPTSDAFTYTPIADGYGSIYVPSTIVSDYQSETNWAMYASQIYPIDDYTDGPPSTGESISDSWAEIFAAEDNGTYSTRYAVGNTKWLDIGGSYVLMQIAAFDADELSSGEGNAKITWISRGIYEGYQFLNGDEADPKWETSLIRTHLVRDILPLIASDVRERIQTVKKVTRNRTNSDFLTHDSLWVPSFREVGLGISAGSSKEGSGPIYSDLFNGSVARIKRPGCLSSNPQKWFVRTGSNNYYCVSTGGGINTLNNGNNILAYALGFCT